MDGQSYTKASSSRGGIVVDVPGGGVFTLSILLVGWCWLGVVAAGVAIPRGHPLPIQDVPSNSEEWSVAELSELLANTETPRESALASNLFYWIHQLRQREQEDVESEDISASSEAGNEVMLAASRPPLLRLGGVTSGVLGTSSRASPVTLGGGQLMVTAAGAEDYAGDKGKRGNTAPACLYKVCYIGRKRRT